MLRGININEGKAMNYQEFNELILIYFYCQATRTRDHELIAVIGYVIRGEKGEVKLYWKLAKFICNNSNCAFIIISLFATV